MGAGGRAKVGKIKKTRIRAMDAVMLMMESLTNPFSRKPTKPLKRRSTSGRVREALSFREKIIQFSPALTTGSRSMQEAISIKSLSV